MRVAIDVGRSPIGEGEAHRRAPLINSEAALAITSSIEVSSQTPRWMAAAEHPLPSQSSL
jgi:hypothetical protein